MRFEIQYNIAKSCACYYKKLPCIQNNIKHYNSKDIDKTIC